MRRQPFADRFAGGEVLASRLAARDDLHNALVLALPPGGVPVGYELSVALGAQFDICLTRPLALPHWDDLVFGDVTFGGQRTLNADIVRLLSLDPQAIDAVTERERASLTRTARRYRGGDRPWPSIGGRTVILVDDGIWMGSPMKAGARAVRALAPARLIAAAPVGSAEAIDALHADADDVVVAAMPIPFIDVNAWYRDDAETTDHDIRHLLARAATWRRAATG
jgi:predicted phosphoribosyltransferase